jgi:glucose-6-phosphate isomerase
MGGSINTVKALIEILGKDSSLKLYTIDSLDPAALEELLSSIPDLSRTLVVGISKSGTTKETQDLLKTLREVFQSQGLKDYQNHFLWLTDLPNQKKIEDRAWQGVSVLPIQPDRLTDIGGRFTAPHTLIFLIPLLLLLNRDISQLKSLWEEYLSLREDLILESANKAYELVNTNTQHFAITLEEELIPALQTWITQLFQESLGSKLQGFNPKTVLTIKDNAPEGFSSIAFSISSDKPIIQAMLNMYLAQIIVALLAYRKQINFVTQPEVEKYKKKMKEVSDQDIPQAQKVTISQLIESIKQLLKDKPNARFLEVVCYWHMTDASR